MDQNREYNILEDKKILTLDSIRFFMILFIVMSHFDSLKLFENTYGIYMAFRALAGMAVDYFFILSGFGMMYSYIRKAPVLSIKPISLIDYALKHVKKIYGLYLILSFICIPYDILSYYDVYGNVGIRSFVNEILKLILCIPLLQSASGMTQLSHALNGVSWFLSTLFCIYLVSPILLTSLGKINRIKSVLVALSLNILILIAVRTLFYEIQERTSFNDLVYGSPYCRVFYVTIGMIVAKIVVHLKSKVSLNGNFFWTTTELLTILFVIALSASKILALPFISVLLPYTGIFISVALIIMFSFEKGFVSFILQRRGVTVLGSMSMFVFLVHYPIQRYFILFFKLAGLQQSFYLYLCSILVTLIFTFAISYVLLIRNKNGMR